MTKDMDHLRRDRAHPPLVDVVAFADGEPLDAATDSHIRSCPACLDQIAHLGGPVDVEEDDADDTVAVLPSAVAELFDSTPDTDPAVGELWHLEWEGAAMLAVVTGIAGDRYEVAVAVPTPDAAEEPARVPADQSPLGVVLSLWLIPDLTVPLGVFAHRAGPVPDTTVADARAMEPQRSWTATLARLDLVPAVETLHTASWVPESAPTESAPSLAELMRARNLKPSDVAAQTGLTAADVVAMVRGDRAVAPSEADELAAMLDVATETIRRPVSIPAALVRAIERPVHRAAIRLRAARDGISEAAARLAAATDLVAMPARTSSDERDVATWDELLSQYLDE